MSFRRFLSARLRRESSARSRHLSFETYEDRRLLAAIARFDFITSIGEVSPAGWTRLLTTSAAAGAVDPSGIGIKFTSSVQGYSANYVASTIPSDATAIRNGFVKLGIAADEATMSFVLTNLDPLKSYEVWVLGSNNTGLSLTQRIAIEGADGTTSFQQSPANLNLWVNQSVGTSAKAVTDISPVVVTSPLQDDLDGDGNLDAHVVRVTATKLVDFTAVQVAGVVIREYTP